MKYLKDCTREGSEGGGWVEMHTFNQLYNISSCPLRVKEKKSLAISDLAR